MATRIKKSFTYVPSSLTEAVAFLFSIGEKQRLINRIKRETKIKVEEITSEAKKKVEEVVKERDTFFVALFAFASSKKADLTRITRSQKTPEGTFGWRWTTPYVEVKEGESDENIIAILKGKAMTQYIRVVEELDREALLRDRPDVPGIAYLQRDEFFAKPKLKREEGSAEELVKTVTEAIDV